MKTQILTWPWHMMLLTVFSSVFFISCEEDEKAKTLPEVTTADVSNVTATSATGGGEIVSDGNAEISASGLVYSSTNATPTIADSKTEETITDGSFISSLEGLTSGTTYHVRAYATNSVGTGYGEVKDFTTGNLAPEATDVAIDGTVEAGLEVMVSYTYSDAEGDEESGTTFQWYVADDIAGSGEVAIEGATAESYTIDPLYEFKYLRVAVTPKSESGTPAGTEVESELSQIAEATTYEVFTYNGQVVAYGIITSSVTGRKWLDRNLGAQRAATKVQDHLAYGDLFQCSRAADGHQLVNWVKDLAPDAGTAVNGTTETLSSTDAPDHNLFILAPADPFDWRSPQILTMWQAPDYVNNPCPSGWHIPTKMEWESEHLETDFTYGKEISLITNELKLVANGYRRANNGLLGSVGYDLAYWTSERSPYEGGIHVGYAYSASLDASEGSEGKTITSSWQLAGYEGASALPCRCIKNE